VTEKEAIKQLSELTRSDPEVSHGRADDILLAFLRSNGFGAVSDAYEEAEVRVGFWYA
jgi:hypothetical protein